MKQLDFLKYLFLSLLSVSLSCVIPLDEKFNGSQTLYIVDGQLTNDSSENFISLRESIPWTEGYTQYKQLTDAEVFVTVNQSEKVKLTEYIDGRYIFPEGFNGKVGNTYQLTFTTSDGKHFESKEEEMAHSTKMEKVYHQFELEAIKTPEGDYLPGFHLFIDLKDAPEETNFYYWKWSLYEKQRFCHTCQNSMYYRNEPPNTGGNCTQDNQTKYLNFIYDYKCESDCWDIFHSSNILIMNDALTNGGFIKQKKVGEIPVLTQFGALAQIKQLGLNESTYDFLKLMRASGSTTGGLADPPPIPLIGNVTSVSHPETQVAGYFLVASLDKQLYWLDKKDVPSNVAIPGLFNFRAPEEEPTGFAGRIGPVPLAPCFESDVRTNILPKGWH